MADQKQTWNLGPHQGLAQRGFALDSPGVLEADNLSFLSDAFLSMRNAFTDEDITDAGFTGEIQWIARHITNDGDEELWAAANNSGTVACARRVGGTWEVVTLPDNPNATNLPLMHSVAFNGKLFLAYDSDENRLHVWDGTSVRRVGLRALSGAPTVADTGSGSYPGTARYYRTSQRLKVGADIITESELSDAVSFTPSGSGLAARISRPTAVDSATHWVVYGVIGSAGDVYDLYEEIAEVSLSTASYDDTDDPSLYDGDAPPVLGSNIPPPSVKCLATDGTRLIMAGAWEIAAGTGETEPAQNRAWFTRTLAATDVGDDENIPDGLWLNIGDAGPVTALGSIYTDVYVFKFGSTHKLIPTQDPDGPFSRSLISENFGCAGQRCVANGETEDGFGAIYFADDHAVYRLAYGAIVPYSEPVGRDMRMQPITPDGSLLAYDSFRRVLLAQISNSATDVLGSYSAFVTDAVKRQWSGLSLAGITSGWTLGQSRLDTDTLLVGGNASIRAAVSALASDGTLRLYVAGQDNDGNPSLRAWGNGNAIDGTTAFTAKVRARKAFGPGKNATIYPPTVYYRNPQGSTSGTLSCTVSLIKNFDEETFSQTFTMDTTQDDNGISFKSKKLESLECGGVDVADCVVTMTYDGDEFDSVTTPTIDALVFPYKVQERV